MPRVIVIGGANADIKGRSSGTYIAGTSNPGDVAMSVGGVGRNIAENLARLGIETALLTVLGDDANGWLIRAQTEAAGVDLSLTLTGPAATGTYLAVLDNRGELQGAINDMRNIEWLAPGHLETAKDRFATVGMLVADCNISAECLSWLSAFAARRNIPLLIEPVSVPKARKLLTFERTAPVYAVTPNRQQLEALAGEQDIASAIARLHALGFANVIVHRGGQGAIASDGTRRYALDAIATSGIADVTGAGDAAVSGLVCGLLDGLPLPEAARLGQAAAAIKLGSRQSVAPELSRDRVLQLAGLS